MTAIEALTDLLTTADAAEFADVTERQIDHWVRIGGVITPSHTRQEGRGRHRRWSLDEAKVLRVLGQLAAINAPMKTLAAVARALQGVNITSGDRRWVVADAEGNVDIVRPSQLGDYSGRAYWSVALATAIPG